MQQQQQDELDEIEGCIWGAQAVADTAQFRASIAAEHAQPRRGPAAQRGRSTARTETGRRRAASAPGERQSRRQRTGSRDDRPAAGPGRGSGWNASTAARAGAGDLPPEPQATDADLQADADAQAAAFSAFRQEMQAENDRCQEELQAEAAAAAADAANRPSEWGERCEEEERRWRRHAPSIGAAVLQQYAAPDPGEQCCMCSTPGCTIR
jgi:hypothetical protein